MTGKEGAYPVYPLYNHPSKKNVIVCKTHLSVFLTNFSLFANPVSVVARTPMLRNVRPCTFLSFEFFIRKTRYCLEPLTSCQQQVSVFRYMSIEVFENDMIDKS